MIKQKSGRIINVSSIAGKMAYSQAASYNSSKAGVILLTKSLAAEWGKHNINVNAICPGVFKTPMTDDFLKDDNFKNMVKTRVPMGRAALPKELSGAAVFLTSKASDYITGHALVVDGGWTCWL